MVTKMLDKAFKARPDREEDMILHSDQGWHYQHPAYQSKLKHANIIQSMSRKGNCLDNSVMENFFGLLKTELLYLKEFDSVEQLGIEIKAYIEYYNNERNWIRLDGMSPIQFRKEYEAA